MAKGKWQNIVFLIFWDRQAFPQKSYAKISENIQGLVLCVFIGMTYLYLINFYLSIVDFQHCEFQYIKVIQLYIGVFFRFFSIISYYKVLNIAPCALQ